LDMRGALQTFADVPVFFREQAVIFCELAA
jgi:hypothetical protein